MNEAPSTVGKYELTNRKNFKETPVVSSSESAKPARDKSKPISSTPIKGTPWCVVWTGDRRVFFFKPSTKESLWECPKELKGRPEVQRLMQAPPGSDDEDEEEEDNNEVRNEDKNDKNNNEDDDDDDDDDVQIIEDVDDYNMKRKHSQVYDVSKNNNPDYDNFESPKKQPRYVFFKFISLIFTLFIFIFTEFRMKILLNLRRNPKQKKKSLKIQSKK